MLVQKLGVANINSFTGTEMECYTESPLLVNSEHSICLCPFTCGHMDEDRY